MPIYEYMADECLRKPACSKHREYIQGVSEPALTRCRECKAPIRRVMSSFAARSGAVGVSAPDPTGLNMTGIPAPSSMPSDGEGGCGHEHSHDH